MKFTKEKTTHCCIFIRSSWFGQVNNPVKNSCLSLKTKKKLFFWNKTFGQRFGANYKKLFFAEICSKFVYFLHFFAFNTENDYFDQNLGCAAPKCWLKYTTTHLLLLRNTIMITFAKSVRNISILIFQFLVTRILQFLH